MYEPRRAPLAPRSVFFRRVFAAIGLVAAAVAVSLAFGMWGYMHFEHLAWRDAFLNAAMLLGGMGPVESPATPGGKVFAGLYALYAGLIFLVSVAIMLAPVVHRLLHRFHWDGDGEKPAGRGRVGGR